MNLVKHSFYTSEIFNFIALCGDSAVLQNIETGTILISDIAEVLQIKEEVRKSIIIHNADIRFKQLSLYQDIKVCIQYDNLFMDGVIESWYDKSLVIKPKSQKDRIVRSLYDTFFYIDKDNCAKLGELTQPQFTKLLNYVKRTCKTNQSLMKQIHINELKL